MTPKTGCKGTVKGRIPRKKKGELHDMSRIMEPMLACTCLDNAGRRGGSRASRKEQARRIEGGRQRASA